MPIKFLTHRSLTEVVAGKLATYILDGTYTTGTQLPTERELVQEYGISRSTLREALKILAEHQLIEGRHGVGWFVNEIKPSNLAKTHELVNLPPNPSTLRPASKKRKQPRSVHADCRFLQRNQSTFLIRNLTGWQRSS